MNDPSRYIQEASECTAKYIATWPKLQARFEGDGNVCDGPRFVDNGDGTVTDNLTGLQWETKTDDGTERDVDNRYTVSASGTAMDGTAFTALLASLNAAGSCHASQCDWRLPSPAELQTILLAPFPCGSAPCIDDAFGPTLAFPYWTSMSWKSDDTKAWYVVFATGAEVRDSPKTTIYPVRAVRGLL